MNANYRNDVIDFVLAHGRVLDSTHGGRPSIYGLGDYTAQQHLIQCGKVFERETVALRENSYWQFEGTDEMNRMQHVVELNPVSCSCGQIHDATLYWGGTAGELLRALLGEKLFD